MAGEIMSHAQQFCTFYLGPLFLGVEVERIQEVIRWQRMTRVPLASRDVSGLINLRGRIVTAVDLRRRLGLEDRPAGQEPMNVVLRTDDGAVSLLVDEIGDVLKTTEESFERVPETLSVEGRSLIRGVHKLKDQLLLVLDADQAVRLGGPTTGRGKN
jgi:purine-binding chemotaxis protein CheW